MDEQMAADIQDLEAEHARLSDGIKTAVDVADWDDVARKTARLREIEARLRVLRAPSVQTNIAGHVPLARG